MEEKELLSLLPNRVLKDFGTHANRKEEDFSLLLFPNTDNYTFKPHPITDPKVQKDLSLDRYFKPSKDPKVLDKYWKGQMYNPNIHFKFYQLDFCVFLRPLKK